MRKITLAVAAALAVVSTAAFATVTFDPVTGTGFVGKGDVQTVIGWNNAQLQANAGGLTFSYVASTDYDAVCTWTTGEGTNGEQTHHVTHSTTTNVSDSIQYSARTHNQIDGFLLNGFGTVTSSGGDVPVVGGPCPGNPGTGGVWTSVTQGASTGGLYVNYNSTAYLLQ